MIADGINSALINYLQTPFAVLSTFTICFVISWQLSLTVFFGFPLLIIPIVFLARRIKRIAKQIQKKQEALASVLVEFISGIQTIKVFAMEDFSKRKYKNIMIKWLSSKERAQDTITPQGQCYTLLGYFALFLP